MKSWMYCVDIGNSETEEASPNFILLEIKEMKYPKIQSGGPNGLEI